MAKRILVTGGNDGIGFALCKQLVSQGCHVYLGARNQEKGDAAVKSILETSPDGKCELAVVDVGSDESVSTAATNLKAGLGSDVLYALVNNAGCGLAHGVDANTVINTNLYGPKRMCDAFLPLLSPSEGRIVNVGSGAGSMYVKNLTGAAKRKRCSEDQSWEEIESHLKEGFGSAADSMSGYGISKALLANYTSYLAKQNPGLKINCASPGFIDTKIVKGYGASKTPEEGTVAIKHLLFGDLEGNGWYYGSDGVRSPLHFMRNPGEPAYDGVLPDF